MPKPAPTPALVNLHELLSPTPAWSEVEASFRNNSSNPAIRAMMLILLDQAKASRQNKEKNPKLSAEECKFWDGAANMADESLAWILELIRGDGEKLPSDVKKLFPRPKVEKE